jgi:hypothetical protein
VSVLSGGACQKAGFVHRQRKHEVAREALDVAFHCLLQGLDLDAIQNGEILIEKDPVSAHDVDHPLDLFERHELRPNHDGCLRAGSWVVDPRRALSDPRTFGFA